MVVFKEVLTHYCSDTKFQITVASSMCSFISRFLTKSFIYFFSVLRMLYASPTSHYPWFDRNVITDIITFSPSLCYFLHRRSRYYHEHNFCAFPQDYSQHFDNLKRIIQNGIFFVFNNIIKSSKIKRRNCFVIFYKPHFISRDSCI